ncbi:MAG: putative DedA family protein [Ignavibacteria bacterium]|nr:putative DedA family protein [Ignavibacteria bacterium]
MLETFIHLLQAVPWYWVLAIALFINILENVFPPAPCDTVLIFTGTLVGLGVVGFIPLVIASTLGSGLGFVLMFYLGRKFGEKVIESGKFSFISEEKLKKPEEWFRKWGYLLIVVNRFLSGTRAVISFFAGISKLSKMKTTVLATLSALVWNIILIYLGIIFGKNWYRADHYIEFYGIITLKIIIFALIIFLIYIFIKKRKLRETS